MGKRLLSLILAAVLLLGMLPVGMVTPARAADVEENVTIKGTNGFGALLSEKITAYQAENAGYESGYGIVDLEIQGRHATVTYSTLEDAVLLVGLYTEDGAQLLCSGMAEVSADETKGLVTIQGDIPRYFMARAFLLDVYDHSPLCASFETPMYTRPMQELLASTVEDYDADRVLNLDDSNDTNFAVYASSTRIIEYAEGVNVVAEADHENGSYVITNADRQILELAVGDVIAYEYGEGEILIVKVASIILDGTTVFLTGDKMEMEEVFSAVKIESFDSTENIQVDPTSMGEGVTFEGLVDDRDPHAVMPMDAQGGTSFSKSLAFSVGTDPDKPISVKGSVELKLEVSFSYYISAASQYVDFKIDKSIEGAFEINGKLEKEWPLCKAAVYPVPGVSVGFQPTIKVGVSGQIKLSLSVKQTLGFTFDNVNGFQPLSLKPQFDPDISVTGKFTFAVDLKPTVAVAEGWIAEFKLELPIGLEVEITHREKGDDMGGENSGVQHACNFCLDAEISFTISFGAEVKFLKCKWLTFSETFASVKAVLGHIYLSTDLGKIGWGVCPNVNYRVTFEVKDENDTLLEAADVWVGEDFPMDATNCNGVTVCYLPAGEYDVLATVDSTRTVRRKIRVEQVCLVTMKLGVEYPDTVETPESLDPEEIIDRGTILFSGDFGENAHWDLYSSGLLEITGTGSVKNGDIPWKAHKSMIKRVIIGDGITRLAESSFYDCKGLAYVTLGRGLVEISRYEFTGCTALKSVSIPDSVTQIGYDAFGGCTALSEVNFGTGVTTIYGSAFVNCQNLLEVAIPDSVTVLGSSAFKGCTSLRTVTMGKGLVTIGMEAFDDCTALANLTIGANVTTIEQDAFSYCTALVSVTIPDSVTTMESGVFYHCSALSSVTLSENLSAVGRYAFTGCTALTTITIPDSVTGIGYDAFAGCTALRSVILGSGVAAIDGSAFEGCRSLGSIKIPDSVKTIGSSAFANCEAMTTVTMGTGVTTIDREAFSGCSRLFTLTIGPNVTTIGEYAFSHCNALTNVTIPNSVNSLGSGAFYRCTALESVQLSQNLAAIDRYTFSGCAALQSVTIPDSVTFLGYSAFADCAALGSVHIGSSVTKIGGNAFENCVYLQQITVPNSVTIIEDQAFAGCKALETVIMGSGVVTVEREAFARCERLTEMLLGSHVTTLGESVFSGCKSLTSITLPDSVVSVGDWAFSNCGKLNDVHLSRNLTALSRGMFYCCDRLGTVTVPASVAAVEYAAFSGCEGLGDVYFTGDAPTFGSSVFEKVIATCHYPAGNATWTADVMQDYRGTIAWVADGGGAGHPFEILRPNLPTQKPAVMPTGIFGGEYGAEEDSGVYYKTASFENLTPGAQYVLLAVIDANAEDLMAPDNLLYIHQSAAAEDGTIHFRYIQRVPTEPSFVMLCGASDKDLKDAQITFPTMYADTRLRAVNPKVVYAGETLVEGIDYIVVGKVDYTDAGTYECMIRGIRKYTGLVSCTYTVHESEVILTPVSFSLSFEDEILVNFYFTAENDADVVQYSMLVFHEDPGKGNVDKADAVYEADYLPASDCYIATTDGIAAKQMGDERYYCAYARLSDGTGAYSGVYSYSPEKYAMSRIQNSADQKLKALCVAMLNYGAAAQAYFGYRTEDLMNAGLTDEQKALVKPYDASCFQGAVKAEPAKTGVFGNASGFGDRSASVSFEGAFAMNFYVKPTAPMDSNLYFYYWTPEAHAGAEVLTAANASGKLVMVEDNGVYHASVEGIAPKDLDKTYYVAGIYLSDAQVCSTGVIAYSLSRYCMSNANGSMGALAQATAMYGYYADAYFA